MKLLHTQRCPTAAKVQVHNLTNQRVYHSRPTTRKGGSRSGGRLLPEMRVSSTESLDYYEEYRSGKKVGTHPASSPRDSGQRRRAVDSSTSLDSHVTTVRGLIAGTGKRSELILLGVQGTAVGTDVPWTTMVALSPMSPMVGLGRSERVPLPGVGNPVPSPGTRTGGTRMRVSVSYNLDDCRRLIFSFLNST
jgi:hypothetical protein